MRRAVPVALGLAVLVVLDQITKLWTQASLPFGEAVPVLPVFSLFHTHNTGVAFSMLDGAGPWPLIALTVAISGFIVWLWWRTPPGRWLSRLGFALVLAGAVGNLIDRVRLGYVIDFALVHTPSFSWTFAVFNLADAFITVGAIAIIADELFGSRLGSTPKETP